MYLTNFNPHIPIDIPITLIIINPKREARMAPPWTPQDTHATTSGVAVQSVPFCYISLANIKNPDTQPPRIIGQNESHEQIGTFGLNIFDPWPPLKINLPLKLEVAGLRGTNFRCGPMNLSIVEDHLAPGQGFP